jgi:hypothetical protein
MNKYDYKIIMHLLDCCNTLCCCGTANTPTNRRVFNTLCQGLIYSLPLDLLLDERGKEIEKAFKEVVRKLNNQMKSR